MDFWVKMETKLREVKGVAREKRFIPALSSASRKIMMIGMRQEYR
jgi:hypothetical protein